LRQTVDTSAENRRILAFAPRLVRGARLVGLAALGFSVLLALWLRDGWATFFQAYLVNFCYFLSLGLGALFFVILQHLTRAGWSVVVRRLAEGLAGTLPVLALLAVLVLVGMGELYPWATGHAPADDHLLLGKQAYLNPFFFAVRMVLYFAVWAGLSQYFLRTSVRQDETGDPRLTLHMQWASAPAMLLFAVTVTFASFDLLMSLEPHWYSTIFGVYFFAGGVLGFLALLVVVVWGLQRSGRITASVTPEHYHDLGKLLLGFTVFWAYIAFSQYMLIWYANIPEETTWYLVRQEGIWLWVSVGLLAGHFLLPFLLLLSRYPKRRQGLLVLIAGWLLLMHWVDLFWLTMPGRRSGSWPLHVLDVTCFVASGALWVSAAAHRLRRVSLVPQRDPRLLESLTFENV